MFKFLFIILLNDLYCCSIRQTVISAYQNSIFIEAEADLGRGVSIYEDAFEWGSMKDLRRRTYNIASARRVQQRANWPRAVRLDLSDGVAYLLVRRVIRSRGPDMEALGMVWSLDRQTVLCAPFSVLDVFARKVLRRVGLKVAA